MESSCCQNFSSHRTGDPVKGCINPYQDTFKLLIWPLSGLLSELSPVGREAACSYLGTKYEIKRYPPPI